MGAIVEVAGISKVYGRQRAVDNVSFRVEEGQIFGFLGPNGAGKTSTIRMLTGITYPDSGSIRLFGEPQRPEHQHSIGYMPEERGLYKKLTVRDQLSYLGALKGLSSAELKAKIDYWLDRFEIANWGKKKTNELSKGMQQKVQFITTVLHDPRLLILDEPLSGLDPVNAELINSIILELREQGKTIVLSTHQMEQVEELCDEIILVNKGQIVLAGGVRELKRASGRTLVRLKFESKANVADELTGLGLHLISNRPNEIIFEAATGLDGNHLLGQVSGFASILHWELIEPPIKELFLTAVQQSQSATTTSESSYAA